MPSEYSWKTLTAHEQHLLRELQRLVLALADTKLVEEDRWYRKATVKKNWERIVKARRIVGELDDLLERKDFPLQRMSEEYRRENLTNLAASVELLNSLTPKNCQHAVREVNDQAHHLIRNLSLTIRFFEVPKEGRWKLALWRIGAAVVLAGMLGQAAAPAALEAYYGRPDVVATRTAYSPPRPSETPPVRDIVPGYYVQYAAVSTLDDALNEEARHAGSIVYESRNLEFPFKVLAPKMFESVGDAMAAIDDLNAPTNAGVIQVSPDGTTAWMKTIEERILDVARQRAPPRSVRPVPFVTVQNDEWTAYWFARIKECVEKDGRRFNEAEAGRILETVRRVVDAHIPSARRLIPNPKSPREPIPFENLVLGVIEVESKFDADAGSRKGARGLMQLVQNTFDDVQKRRTVYTDVPRILDIEQNIECGTMYLAELIEKNPKENLAKILRYYNGGKRAVESGRLKGNRENLSYPDKVLETAERGGIGEINARKSAVSLQARSAPPPTRKSFRR